ncbi:acetate kinase, partial [Candidatus Magnetoovum chiemensis]
MDIDIERFISNIDIFSNLTKEELNLLLSNATLQEFAASQTVLKQGASNRTLYILNKGEAEVIFKDERGSKVTIAMLKEGDFFGEISILTGEPTVCEVNVKASSKVIRIPVESVSQVIMSNTFLLRQFAGLMAARLKEKETIQSSYLTQSALSLKNDDPYDLYFSSATETMRILVINCGSSSLKYSLFDTSKKDTLFEGLIEKIGSEGSYHKIKTPKGKLEKSAEVKTIERAFEKMQEALTDPDSGALKRFDEINAVGHRVVHGGDKFSSSTAITDDVIDAIKQCITLAPLHNPYNLSGIETMKRLLPNVAHVAVFDTAYHQTMPDYAYLYSIPYELYEKEHLRRYGFHGTNHHFVSLMCAVYLKLPLNELKIITCHLGNGASICAIEHGRSIDTSMGMTPLEGLVMGTRCGDIDPSLVVHMLNSGQTIKEIDTALNKSSGLVGVSAVSNDMREILQAAEYGNKRAELAISMFCYRIKKYIGSYITALGSADALVFTGGIGENSTEIRARVCQGLGSLGIVIDDELNRNARAERGKPKEISISGKTKILIISADEERMIARETIRAMGRFETNFHVKRFKELSIPITPSPDHVHLSKADF